MYIWRNSTLHIQWAVTFVRFMSHNKKTLSPRYLKNAKHPTTRRPSVRNRYIYRPKWPNQIHVHYIAIFLTPPPPHGFIKSNNSCPMGSEFPYLKRRYKGHNNSIFSLSPPTMEVQEKIFKILITFRMLPY